MYFGINDIRLIGYEKEHILRRLS